MKRFLNGSYAVAGVRPKSPIRHNSRLGYSYVNIFYEKTLRLDPEKMHVQDTIIAL